MNIFSTAHLTRLIDQGAVPATLYGVRVGIPPMSEGDSLRLDNDLAQWGITQRRGQLTEQAHTALSPLWQFDQAITGEVILVDKQAPVPGDVAPTMSRIGMAVSPVTPCVQYLLTAHDRTITAMVIAGLNINIFTFTSPSDSAPTALAACLMDTVLDPTGALLTPMFAVKKVPESTQATVTIPAVEGVVIESVTAITHLDTYACESEQSASIAAYANGAALLSYATCMPDGKPWRTYAPLTREHLGTCIQALATSPRLPR